jgi:Xaa-Pro aminopeptidase
MAKLDDAVKLVTDGANVSDTVQLGARQVREVKQARVLAGLKRAGAGKAEARELALEALEKVEGGVETHIQRGAMRPGGKGERTLETWWIPADAVRW